MERDLLTFSNERELQITMAAFLRGCPHYDNVFTEYPVTLDEIQHFGKTNLLLRNFHGERKLVRLR